MSLEILYSAVESSSIDPPKLQKDITMTPIITFLIVCFFQNNAAPQIYQNNYLF